MSKDAIKPETAKPSGPPARSIETRDHGDFEFQTQAGYEAAKRILGTERTIAWAHRVGPRVRFLTWPDGQEQFVFD